MPDVAGGGVRRRCRQVWATVRGCMVAADGLAEAVSEYEMDAVGHQAVGVEVEGVSGLGLGEGFEMGSADGLCSSPMPGKLPEADAAVNNLN